MSLVSLLNPKFAYALAANRGANFGFGTLGDGARARGEIEFSLLQGTARVTILIERSNYPRCAMQMARKRWGVHRVNKSAEDQLPQDGQIFLDHAGWMVPDLDTAGPALARLGFTLTPHSVHYNWTAATGTLEPSGTANRLVMLRKGYLEVLGATPGATTPLARHVGEAVARHVGIHLVAFTVKDAAAETRRLSAAGIALQPAAHLRRTVEAEDTTPAEVAFTVVRAEFDQFPEARAQVLTHHTPEHMWQDRYVGQDNAIAALTEVTFVVDDPAEAALRFSRLVDRPATGSDRKRIDLDRGRLLFVTRRDATQLFGAARLPPNPSVGAITLTSSDLDRTRNVFLSNGIQPGSLGLDHLLIDAGDALGVHLVVVPG